MNIAESEPQALPLRVPNVAVVGFAEGHAHEAPSRDIRGPRVEPVTVNSTSGANVDVEAIHTTDRANSSVPANVRTRVCFLRKRALNVDAVPYTGVP